MNIVPLPTAPTHVAPPSLRLRGIKLAGASIIALFFGVAGGWAALAPLDSAAIAPGVIKVAGERKQIQHLEGGIVAEMNVVNGDIVKAGTILIRLDATQARAQLDLTHSRIVTREALAARLRAERDGKASIEFPAELLANESAAAREAVATQRDLFNAKYHNLNDGREILVHRRHQTEEEIAGLEQVIATQEKQIAAIEGETKDLEALIAKGLATRERNLLLHRQQRDIEGQRATNLASIASARSAISEIDMQTLNLDTQRMNEAVEELSKTEAELADLREQERGAKDVLARTEITAPVDGIVMDLKVHTTGGVVKPGDTLLTVVPLGEQLIVEAMVKPEDIETIAPGQVARISFPALARYNLPPLDGTVDTVSADRLTEERSGAPYFAATVIINKGELDKLDGRKLLPGMSSEAMIRTGSRTMLTYLAEPITQNLRRSLREK